MLSVQEPIRQRLIDQVCVSIGSKLDNAGFISTLKDVL